MRKIAVIKYQIIDRRHASIYTSLLCDAGFYSMHFVHLGPTVPGVNFRRYALRLFVFMVWCVELFD